MEATRTWWNKERKGRRSGRGERTRRSRAEEKHARRTAQERRSGTDTKVDGGEAEGPIKISAKIPAQGCFPPGKCCVTLVESLSLFARTKKSSSDTHWHPQIHATPKITMCTSALSTAPLNKDGYEERAQKRRRPAADVALRLPLLIRFTGADVGREHFRSTRERLREHRARRK